jgi:hypothetical protein
VAIVAVPSITITGTQTLRGNGGCLECINAIGDKLREYVRERENDDDDDNKKGGGV